MNWISLGDFIDIYFKVKQRGWKFLLSKFRLKEEQRIKTTWQNVDINSSNWWIIPIVNKRWNYLISGNSAIKYTDYVVNKYFKNRTGLKMLSPGCGNGSHEIEFAKYKCFESIEAFDIADNRINLAIKEVSDLNLTNLKYFTANIYNFNFENEKYDLILFCSSLHHFRNLWELLQKVKNSLKPNGLLIIHEYVGPNRFQYPDKQINIINELLINEVPLKYRTRLNSNSVKSRVYSPGLLRMIISDPSEAIRSSDIITTLRNNFNIVEEIKLGGDILHLLLKDIAHNFLDNKKETLEILERLLIIEDRYLADKEISDFMFGIYRKKNEKSF